MLQLDDEVGAIDFSSLTPGSAEYNAADVKRKRSEQLHQEFAQLDSQLTTLNAQCEEYQRQVEDAEFEKNSINKTKIV